jgi:peroxiredoxin
MGISRRIYFVLGICALVVAMAGLIVGKKKEQAYIEALETHHDFTLLDDTDDLFQLNKFPANERLLLIFTPSGIPTNTVKPFYEFSRHLGDFAKAGIRVKMVTRTNREIVANFKRAARFDERVLLDVGGVVGRSAGAWPSIDPVTYWTYVLTDRQFKIHWTKMSEAPLSYEEVRAALPKN